MNVATLVEQVARVPGVKAVTLGGSRARGMARPDSDWDIGLYYRDSIDCDAIRELGYAGHVTEPGAWGRIVNGGAWLQVDRERVDLLYRDLDVVEHWIAEADAGRFEIDHVGGHIAGLPTYVLASELALGTVLRGSLPRPSFSAALRRAAPPRWEETRRSRSLWPSSTGSVVMRQVVPDCGPRRDGRGACPVGGTWHMGAQRKGSRLAHRARGGGR